MQREEDMKEYLRLRMKFMYNRVFNKILANQEKEIDTLEYKYPAQTIKEYAMNNPQKFDSAHEMATAFELLRKEVMMTPQASVASYNVDFLLKELHIILEIDGHFHKYHKNRDSNRDKKIRKEKGEKWEVIRIPTKYIEQNIQQLVPAIKELYKAYKKARSTDQFNELPGWFTRRNETNWTHIPAYLKDQIKVKITD